MKTSAQNLQKIQKIRIHRIRKLPRGFPPRKGGPLCGNTSHGYLRANGRLVTIVRRNFRSRAERLLSSVT
ncbi:hypothetical protein GCK72_021575 [Caenorhabditis remanei]|uniref:Uncharacterized protein n=1 Tax=Caenorhabditis remanei TaxID=31234 RepID=A0A6A5GIJ1_CAERE|nr:hypothetical protein GCK72_021575 [Caenorhabditis remanei]KAF1755008.1 hypothetical protein GCK72_021575 [Caenorhabditis remanei]